MSYVESTRLPVCRWLAAAALGFLALNSHAAIDMYNWNGLEFVRSGNVSHVHPASPESTVLRGGRILGPQLSTSAPEINARALMPYKTQVPQYIDVKAKIKPLAFASAAKDALKLGLKGAVLGSGYLSLANIACELACSAAKDLLLGSGVDSVKAEGDALLFAGPDPSFPTPSESTEFTTLIFPSLPHPGFHSSAEAACRAAAAVYPSIATYSHVVTDSCFYTHAQYGLQRVQISFRAKTCPSGSYISGTSCTVGQPKKQFSDADLTQKLQGFADPNTGYWGTKAANLAALIEAAQNGRLVDATGISLSGPASSPVSTATKVESVNLQPGTTTPVAPGHVGPSDSGTRTTTSTSTVKNSYSGNSMTATPTTTTTTTITNNVTNITNVTNNSTETTDQAPEEEEKDPCEKNPDSLACAELDTPEQDVPRREINISYEYANIFGNGACPSDAYLNTHGQSLKVWDWQATCSNVQDYFRPVLIACCAFAAFVIVTAGGKE